MGNHVRKMANGARIGPGIPHLSDIGICPGNSRFWCIAHPYESPLTDNTSGDFNWTGDISHKTEFASGEPGNRIPERIKIYGVVNVESAMVTGDFFGCVTCGSVHERQRVRSYYKNNCFLETYMNESSPPEA